MSDSFNLYTVVIEYAVSPSGDLGNLYAYLTTHTTAETIWAEFTREYPNMNIVAVIPPMIEPLDVGRDVGRGPDSRAYTISPPHTTEARFI